jgi:hypothetical protein
MQPSKHLDVFIGDTFDPRILWMGMQRDLSLDQPLTQRLGIDSKLCTTVCQGKQDHGKAPFESEQKQREDSLGKIPRNEEELSQEFFLGIKKGDRVSFLPTTFGVVKAGKASVATSPPGPGQEQRSVMRVRPEEVPQKMTNFRPGQRKQSHAALAHR